MSDCKFKERSRKVENDCFLGAGGAGGTGGAGGARDGFSFTAGRQSNLRT